MRNEGEREGGNAVGSNSYLIVAECFDLRGRRDGTARDERSWREEEEEEDDDQELAGY